MVLPVPYSLIDQPFLVNPVNLHMLTKKKQLSVGIWFIENYLLLFYLLDKYIVRFVKDVNIIFIFVKDVNSSSPGYSSL